MTSVLRIKRRQTGAVGAPTSLANAELAYNEVNHTLYYGEGTGGTGGSATTVVPIAGSGAFLPLGGGTLAGPLTLSADPVAGVPGALQPATRQYVDARSGLVVSTIAALRAATTATLPATNVVVRSYAGVATKGGGWFLYMSTDTTTADNGGTIIVDASGRRWYREGSQDQPLNIYWFGARGDGTTNDAPAIQTTINVAVASKQFAIYLPSASVYYLLSTPLNLTNLERFTIVGDGCYPLTARITPTGSTLAGNTGAGGCIIDATGTSGLTLRNFNLASIGLPNPATVGLILGNSSTNTNGGSSNYLDNVSILMPATGSSVPLYGVNVNLLTLVKVNTFGDYGWYITNANDLSINRPYGVAGSNIQSDGISSVGGFLAGYGTQAPFILVNCTAHTHDQLYIVNVNGSSTFAGHAQAMLIDNCTDIKVKVEIDYFPSAVVQLGDWYDVDLSGLIYASPSPLVAGLPAVMALVGRTMYNVNMAIRVLSAAPAGTYYYSSASSSPTERQMMGCRFIFDTNVVPNTLYYDVTGITTTPILNCHLNGNTDTPGVALFINEAVMPTSAYRLWVNGLRTGLA